MNSLYNAGVAYTKALVSRSPKRRQLRSRAAADALITTVVLPRRLHARARLAAFKLNWSFTELVRTSLRAWLDSHAPTDARPNDRGAPR
jgi:hypothetical protein